MSEKTYPARIYRPRHKRQRLTVKLPSGKTVLIGCTDTCTAMYADAVSFGAINVSESQIRKWSTEPVPDLISPGLNIPQIREVCRNDLHISMADGTGKTWAELVTLLDDNRRIVAQLDYAKVGGNAIGHAFLLQARRVRPGGPAGYEILCNDPMKSAEQWIVDDKIRAAMESFGRQTGIGGGGLRFAYSLELPYEAAGA